MYLSVGTLKSQHNYSSPIKFNLQPISHLTGSRQGAEWDGEETGWLFRSRQQLMAWLGRQSWVLPEVCILAGREPSVKDSVSDPRPSTFYCVSQVASYKRATSRVGMLFSILGDDQPPGQSTTLVSTGLTPREPSPGVMVSSGGRSSSTHSYLDGIARGPLDGSHSPSRVSHWALSLSWPSRSCRLPPGIKQQENPLHCERTHVRKRKTHFRPAAVLGDRKAWRV